VVDHFDPTMPDLRHNFMRTWQGEAPSQFAEAPQGGSMFRWAGGHVTRAGGQAGWWFEAL
jgi:hypothetical protein